MNTVDAACNPSPQQRSSFLWCHCSVCVCVCVHNKMINLSLASLKSYYKMLKTHIKVK